MKCLTRLFSRLEIGIAFLLLLAMVSVPVLSVLGRAFPRELPFLGLPGAGVYMSHLLLFIALSAGLCVSHARRNISITLFELKPGRWTGGFEAVRELWKLLLLLLLFVSTVSFFSSLNVGSSNKIAGLPQWLWLLPLVVATAILLLYQVVSTARRYGCWVTLFTLLLALLLAQAPLLRVSDLLSRLLPQPPQTGALLEWSEGLSRWLKPLWIPAIVITLVFSLAGLPIYLGLAGLALFSFMHSQGFPEIVINDFYALFTENVILQSLPLFAFAGFILSEGRAAQRLVDFLDLLIGHVRGGVAIMAVVLSSFFTALTGASGVTILAMGGLFAVILERSGYSRSFSLGLLTSCGSIGLLFPPSLPIIMYSVGAGISIKNMFLAGLLPGLLLVAVTIVMALYHSRNLVPQLNHPRETFSWKLLSYRFRLAQGELLLPALLVVGIFFLKVTMVELSAFSVLYCLILVLIHRDYTRANFVKMLINYLEVLGGILLVIGFARGLADYLALHDVASWLARLVEEHIHNKWLFLLLLNLLLLLTGAIMDIYSAIIIVAPLVIAMGERYQIAPEQLGIIFLSNLELGYMTPPVGMSLFLARYRFNVPIVQLYRYVMPFLFIMLAAVLLITYLPWLSLALLPKG